MFSLIFKILITKMNRSHLVPVLSQYRGLEYPTN